MIEPGNEFFDLYPLPLNPRYINKNYPKFFEYINNIYPGISSISEKIYRWRYNIKQDPLCPVCGKKLKFYGFNTGYQQYCSYKCANNNEVIEKRKQTCLEKYGVENPNQCKEIKEKSKQTCLEKYGVENPFASEKIKKQIKQTCLEKYGVEYSGQNEEVKSKAKNTLKFKYGVDSPLQLPQTSINRQKKYLELQKEKYDNLIDIEDVSIYVVNCPHKNCNKCQEKQFKIPSSIFFDRRRDKTELCTNLLPVKCNLNKGNGLEQSVWRILDDINIEYKSNVWKIIQDKELDVYIPSKNIAIECNGNYSHCSRKKDPKYHLNKTNACKEVNIQLLHIWEDWVKNKYDIVKSLISAKLGIFEKRIGARQCKIEEISIKTCNNFLKNNHIQGGVKNSFVNIGLFYDCKLVAVMSFSKGQQGSGNLKKNKDDIFLNRFCTLLNMQIIGGADKLMKYFITKYNPTHITSFSLNDISDGNLYKKLGFIENGFSQSYWWIKSGTLKRYHRSNFTKRDIVRLGWKDKIDDTWTEEDVMYAHGYKKIIDSGMTKWVWINPNIKSS